MSAEQGKNRLLEIDALRGLAALAVVLFHYTTRFEALYGASPPATWSFPDGHYGVNLFFIISGFVIFMTLEKTSRPMDFVVSRFSRLFPAFWAAIILTFSITHLLGLPGKQVDLGAALGNLIMIHGLFGIPHVDSVYWTLEIELLFYCGMFVLYRTGRLRQVHYALWFLLGLRLAYHVLKVYWDIELPWIISHLLILKYIPWFALGISIYLISRPNADRLIPSAITSLVAVLSLYIVDSLFVGSLAIALALVVYAAASGRAPILGNRVLLWLGSISYPLYLLHENIGWSILLRLQASGIATDASVAITLTVALLMATALARWVERPAMALIRQSYRNRRGAVR